MKKYYYIAAMLFVLTSCEPNELPETFGDEEVLFYVEGTLNGNEFFLEAGPDNVIVEADAVLIEDELPFFSSEFFNVECEECDERLELVFTGDELFNENELIHDLLPEDFYVIMGDQGDPIFGSEYFVLSDASQIVFFDPSGLEIDVLPGIGPVSLDEEGEYEYIAMYDDFFECMGSVSGSFYVSESGEVCMNQIHFGEDDLNPYFDFSDFETEFITVSFNGNPFVITDFDELVYLDDLMGVVGLITEISVLSIGGPENCVQDELIYEFDNGFLGNCFPEIYIEQFFEVEDPTPRSVIVRYVDSEGDEYISEENLIGNTFSVLEIEEYAEDPFDREAFRALIQFTVNLRNVEDQNDVIIMDVMEGYIPVVLE